ncbi:helix-turn-helix domain-containing protein [Pseudonocardia saturnea]
MNDFDGLPVLISVVQAADLLGISRASAYRYIAGGLLPVQRLGGRIYIVRDRLRDMIENTEEITTG